MVLGAITHAAPCDTVFVHGAGGNNVLWSEVLQVLSGDGIAFAVNLPGHPSGDIVCRTIEEYAESVFNFVTDRELRPVICGHSMGGAIAMALVLDHPTLFPGLILVGSGAKLGVLPELISGLREDALGVIERDITPLSFHRLDLELGRKARAALSLSNPAIFLNDYLACAAFDVRGRLKEISTPTLIVCGDDDRMTPPKWSRYLHSNIRSSKEPEILGEVGHMLPIEKPTECGHLVQSFLLEISR